MICLKKKSDGKSNTCKNGKLVNSFNGTTAPIFSEHVKHLDKYKYETDCLYMLLYCVVNKYCLCTNQYIRVRCAEIDKVLQYGA